MSRSPCKTFGKRIIICLALAAAALFMTGCGATLTVYDSTEDGVRYNQYELTLDDALVSAMENSAAVSQNGEKMKVADYLARIFSDYGYTLVRAENGNGTYTVCYRKAVGENGELFAVGSKVSFASVSTQTPFIKTYVSTSQNPFNGVRKTYDEVLPDRSVTVLERIKNGLVTFNGHGDRIVEYPSLTEAFPYVKGCDPSALLLGYVRYGSKRMRSSGAQRIAQGSIAEYRFTRYFDDSYTEISFEYDRAVPYGWYIIAIAAGAAVLGIFVLATRAKKPKKPTLTDRFPYNPEEFRDYETRLPSDLR